MNYTVSTTIIVLYALVSLALAWIIINAIDKDK